MPEQDVPGRRLKYRMSCDICHAAKIKCGSQKPSCRRCSIKKLDCVYSISHRKGRPREKRKGPEDSVASEYLLPEPMHEPDIWTPPTTNFEVPVTAEQSEESGSQPAADSLGFPTGFDSFEIDDSFDFPTMLGSLDEPTILDDREPNTTGSTSQVESGELHSPEMLELSEKDLFGFIDTRPLLQQDHLRDDSMRRVVTQSERFPHAGFTSIIGNIPVFNGTLDNGLEFLQNEQVYQQQRRARVQPSGNPTYPTPSEDFPPFCEDGARKDQSRANCECFVVLLRRIRCLKSKQKSRGLIPIGSVLMMERETNECLSKLHRCKSCSEDSIAYLFAMVSVRIVLDLMQKSVHNEFMTGNRRTSQSSGTGRSRMIGEQSLDQGRSRGQRDGSSLYIGNFKVPARARRRYLREMLQARFSKFLVLVEEREKLVKGVSQDCFAEGASALMGNIARDLKTILGWMELWSSRD